MCKNHMLAALLLAIFSNLVHASAPIWVGTVSLGPVWSASNGENQTFYLDPGTERTYDANSTSNVLVDGEAFLGLQMPFNQFILGQIGLAVAATGSADVSGDIWDDADPQFNNYEYEYKVRHTHVAVKGKLLADWGFWFTPWVSASVGVGFNKAYDFINTPTIFEALPTSNFTSQTDTSFTYTLGLGIQKSVSAHWLVGIGYEFADWGKSTLGKATGQTLNEGLSLDHLYTNGVLFDATYLF